MNRIPEHTVVKTVTPVREDHTLIPVGSQGTIVHVHPSGYEVEFPLGDDGSLVIYCPEDSIKGV